MSELIIALEGLLCALLAVFCYRLGLGDGMRREQGLEPVLRRPKPRKPTEAEEKARLVAEAVENFR